MSRFALALTVALALVACNKEEAHDHDHDHDHDHAHEEHVHEAAYGGTLIELGEHAAQAELVFEQETGTVTVYLWDSCVTKPARSKQIQITVQLELGGETVDLALEPVANPLTGETFGDTSKFEARSDRLEGMDSLRGRLGTVEVFGTGFGPTPFELK